MRSTYTQFEEFLTSRIWKDICDEIDSWIDDIHIELEDRDGTKSIDELKRLGGNVQACHRFKMLPKILAENLLIDREQKEKEAKNDRKC